MKIFSASQVREIDKGTIEKEPISSLELMERASLRFMQWFTNHYDASNHVVVFAGTGNNGGDALAISRMLIEKHYPIKVFFVSDGSSMSDDCRNNLEKLKKYTHPIGLDFKSSWQLPVLNKNDIIIDGIFGSGLNRPIEEPIATLIRGINQAENTVVSIDIPSGLFVGDNRNNKTENIIRATFTISFEFPFFSFFMSENEKFVGTPVIIPIGLNTKLIKTLETAYNTIDDETVRKLLIPRNKYSHKGTYGHALIIAGRFGMMGAALLSAKACLRGGAGLTTVCIPLKTCGILQTAVPEALVSVDPSDDVFSKLPDLINYQSIACGPAIGKSQITADALHDLLITARVPVVLDADALNILAENKDWLDTIPENSVITPHPKEFDRLAGISADSYTRHLKQIEFARKFRVIVVLKGANTIICTPDGKSFINTSGNPGMSSGGTGDVLTGLTVSLLAQGYKSLDASIIAVYIHGLAGDIALESTSMEALIASDIIDNLGMAFRKVKGVG
jgi:NAD(P)H-hydrate epimerase